MRTFLKSFFVNISFQFFSVICYFIKYSRGAAEHRNEIHNTARCLAELTHSWAVGKGNVNDHIQPVIEQMLQDAQHSDSEKVKQFSLLTLGEMGRRIPLGPTVIQQQISQFKVI